MPIPQRSAFVRLVTKGRSKSCSRRDISGFSNLPPLCSFRVSPLGKSIFGSGLVNSRMGPRSREGRCDVRIWVDHHAELRIRGDSISVRTVEGGRSYDEGSKCSQPLPYNSISDFQVRQTAGRSRVNLVQQPSRMNNYSAVLNINDDQGGGDHYAFEVTWRSEGDRPDAPAPFFDDVRACQDSVRQRF